MVVEELGELRPVTSYTTYTFTYTYTYTYTYKYRYRYIYIYKYKYLIYAVYKRDQKGLFVSTATDLKEPQRYQSVNSPTIFSMSSLQ